MYKPSPAGMSWVRTRYLSNLGNWVALLSAADAAHILGVLVLRRLREVEAAGEDRLAIDDDHLVMGNRVVGVDHGRHPLVGQEVRRGIFLRALTLIEDDLHLDATLMGVQ
jgi:hypothetical protein